MERLPPAIQVAILRRLQATALPGTECAAWVAERELLPPDGEPFTSGAVTTGYPFDARELRAFRDLEDGAG